MDEADYMRAIIDDPDDDAPRLAYADWLDRKEPSPRAEFIRLQIELARSPDHPDRARLQAREAELLEQYEATWAPDNSLCLFLSSRPDKAGIWRRGFVAVLDPMVRCVSGGEDSLKHLAKFPLAEEVQLFLSISDAEFLHMPVLPNLRSLALGGNAVLSNDSLRAVGRWRTLRRLRLEGPKFTNQSLAYLNGLAELKDLILDHTSVTDEGLAQLAPLQSLETLDLSDTKVAGSGFAALGNLPRLRSLNLVSTQPFDHRLGDLRVCGALEELLLGDYPYGPYPLNDADLLVLAELPALRALDLFGFVEFSADFAERVRRILPSVELRYEGVTIHAPNGAMPRIGRYNIPWC